MILRVNNSICLAASAPVVHWLSALMTFVCFVGSVIAQENETRVLSANQIDTLDRGVIVGVLENYCADCHLDGADEGGVTLDALVDHDTMTSEKKLWDRALKQLRHDLMPPRDMDQPTAEEQLAVEQWIKGTVFAIDPDEPDPGHVIVRRLNRIEYRNTIKDLFDYEINTKFLFPPDDTGHGFDNMAEVLTVSPLLMEKYIDAATEVMKAKVPGVLSLLQRHGDSFPDSIPADNDERRRYAGELLFEAAKKAFRRPPESETVDRLVELAESVWSTEDNAEMAFERGIAQAVIAILSSPNFIFRETFPLSQADSSPENKSARTALIDEYSLASRLSYFLWSTMPDDGLIELAEQGKLRRDLDKVVNRMLDDGRFVSFYKNFMGQWLRTRDIEHVTIDAFAVARSDEQEKLERSLRVAIDRLRKIKDQLTEDQRAELKACYRQLKSLYKKTEKFALNTELRRSMRRETEMLFEHIVNTDSDLIQLIDCDFTFLDERLANHYGIQGVRGKHMRRVELDPEDHRGGILTHGSFLAVTSNPDRTSPVKRGVFVLDNLLGMPPGSPPPNIPELEVSSGEDLTKFTLRKSLSLHREDPLCSSCHNRMDPLGLALENYDALGRYRTHESEIEIDASGELIWGESFKNIDDLKRILATGHKEEFYRCVTEKLMTYALGRSVEYYDIQTIDDIVASLLNEGGKPSVLIKGIVESPAFQMTRLESLPAKMSGR